MAGISDKQTGQFIFLNDSFLLSPNVDESSVQSTQYYSRFDSKGISIRSMIGGDQDKYLGLQSILGSFLSHSHSTS